MSHTKVRLINLEEMFKSWAWTNYQRRTSGFSNWFKGRLKFRDAIIELKWEQVKIKPRKPNYTEAAEGSKPDQRIVIESEYENETSKDQTHSFRTERETTSTAIFVVRKGMKKGVETKLEMPLPEEMLGDQSNENQPTDTKKVLKMATASFGNSLSLDVEEGNSVSKTLKWAVDTTITSMNDSLTVAKLEINETQAVYDLSVEVDIKGTIVAVIKNTHGKQVMTVEGDVATVLNDFHQTTIGLTRGLTIDMRRKRVSVTIAGKVTFKYGVSQRVKVSYGTKHTAVKRLTPKKPGSTYSDLESDSSSDADLDQNI